MERQARNPVVELVAAAADRLIDAAVLQQEAIKMAAEELRPSLQPQVPTLR